MLTHPWLLLLIIIANIINTQSGTTTLGQPTNIDAQRVLLYPTSAVTMVNQRFTVTFNLQFNTTPVFAMGLNQYKMGDRFYV